MRWIHPEEARWLLAIPWLLVAWGLYLHAKRRFRRRVAGPPLATVSRMSSGRYEIVTLSAALASALALVAALMGPERLIEARTPAYERRDLVIVLDRSASMRAADIRPSRFLRAIADISTLLLHKPEGIDRVALVGFAGTAVVLTYPTRDMESLLFYLEWLAEDEELHFGTDLGTALLTAHQVATAESGRHGAVVLAVSDGDDQGRRLGVALARLIRDRIPVHTLGIGSDRPVLIPVAGPTGPTRYLEDEEGRPLMTRFGETTLRQIATATGGRYIRSATGTEVASALRELVEPQRLVGWSRTIRSESLHRAMLTVAAIALAVLIVRL